MISSLLVVIYLGSIGQSFPDAISGGVSNLRCKSLINREEKFMLNKQNTCVPIGISPRETGFGYTMSVIGGKYKMMTLHILAEKKSFVIMSYIG